jgi:hypothetical protein
VVCSSEPHGQGGDDGHGAPAVCPRLGFADDPSHHYSRPTALHRCFAGPTPSLIANREQLELCLGDRFPTCLRFRAAAGTAAASSAGAVREMPLPDRPAPEPPTPASGAGLTVVRARRWPLALVGRGAAAVLALVGVTWALVVFAVNRAQEPIPSSLELKTAAPRVVATLTPLPAVPALLPTPRPAPTAAPRPATPTAVPTPDVAGVGSLVDIRFTSGPADRWLEHPPYATWSNGAYRLHAADATQFVAVGVPLGQDLDDGVVSATFRKTGGPPGGGYGLILRDQGPQPRDGANQDAHAYVFEAGDLGEFGVWRRDGDHWVDLVPWTRSNVVWSGGSPNDLTVRAIGPRLTFTINGVQVAAVEDDALASGGVGIFVGGDYNEVALDHFAVQLPD